MTKEILNNFEKVRLKCAQTLNLYQEHHAGGGSIYINTGNIVIRIADHENTSKWHGEPDYNLVNRNLTAEETKEIVESLVYPQIAKQKAFSLHVNISIPKLKKILLPEFYSEIIEDPYYYNTVTKVVKVRAALDYLTTLGFNDRIPVVQKIISHEDYCR